MRVWYPRISKAPNSASTTSPTRIAPPRIASLAWPTVTVQKVRTRPRPRLRATSSCAGSAERRLAATGRKTSGYTASVITSTAAQNPPMEGNMARHPKLTTKSGMPSGITTRTANTRRNGQIGPLDEPCGQGADDRARTVTTTTERHRVPHQHRRQVAEQELVQLGPPHLDGLDDQEHERRAARPETTTAMPVTDAADGSARPSGGVPGTAPSSPYRPSQQLRLLEELDRLRPGSEFGDSDVVGLELAKGVSGCAVVTPDAIGYSKLSLWAMICCPCIEVKKARNRWASSLCGDEARMPAARHVDDVPDVVRQQSRRWPNAWRSRRPRPAPGTSSTG